MPSAGVVGSPINHSLSPVMHLAAYVELGLDWNYTTTDLPPGGLAGFVEALPEDWHGLSVTMPLKREAAALASRSSDDVAFLGVANTLVRDGVGWSAANTDIPGALGALRERGVERAGTVRIVGAGATATSMVVVAHRLGVAQVRLVARDPRRAESTAAVARDLGLDVIIESLTTPVVEGTDLLVCTVPPAAVADRAHEFAGSARAIFDVSYDPFPTSLAEAAAKTGRTVVNGIDLLAHQAVLQVDLMTGRPVDIDVLRRAALEALAARP